nr:acyl carrier protein 1, mitochondrial [Ipomoea batatas]
MASALRSAILRHVRVPATEAISANGSRLSSARWMSSHDDHLSKEEVAGRVLDVVKTFPKVDPSKVTPDVHFQKDLGLDSLDNVEIVMALEEEFKLEIPDKEAVRIDSCTLAIEYIYNHPMADHGNLIHKEISNNHYGGQIVILEALDSLLFSLVVCFYSADVV